MLRVCFNCYGSYTTDTVFQWDLNHILEIRGLTVDHAPTVHFCNRKSETAIVVQSEKDGDAITAPVPNQLLQEPYNIIAYVHVYDENHAKTVEIVNIPLTKRVKPDDYQFTENVDVMNFERLEKDITDFIALMTSNFEAHTAEVENDITEFKNTVNDKYDEQNKEIEDFEADVNNTLAEIKRESMSVDGRLPGEDPENERSFIKPRRGTATLWAEANPVLLEGELGIELPEGVSNFIKIKIGDGVKAWNELPYGVAPLSIIDNLTSTNTDLPLSANQGRVLKSDIDTKLPKSGGQITGNITGTDNSFKIAPTGDIYSDKWGSKWLSTALGEKVTTGTQSRFADITLGSVGSLAYIYQQNEDIKFRFKGADGTTKYTTLDTLVLNITSNATKANDLLNRFGKTCKIITDWNAVTESGFYMAQGASNAPDTTSWFIGIVLVHNSNYIIQEVWHLTGGDTTTLPNKYTRVKNTSWRPWIKEPRFKYNASTGTLDITL